MNLTEEQIHTFFNNVKTKIKPVIQQMNLSKTLERYEMLMLETVPQKSPTFSRCYEHKFIRFDIPFAFQWDFTKFDDIVKKNRIGLTEFFLEPLYNTVELESINLNHLNQVSSEPIVVGLIAFSSPPMVILDGNHRVVSSYNKHNETISCYFLDQQHHLQAMPEDQQTIYKILNNIILNTMHVLDHASYDIIKTQLFDI